ncbi:restriction endonuclease subunit S [Pelagicoccus albus]|uniref:Restriction endonuclease subunit S n=1 Tax=Pelagicoccus albus TaxID=415222 RepID=A0A7X1B815_9BACT|nr:restriction endonuclease subunit S [Pelagicoccus albus]MBC2606090.1 restriction endonuclease subunit S [Pelagicoccus albus]
MNIKHCRLADIVEIFPGYPFRGPVEEKERGSHYVLQLKNVQLGRRIDWNNCTRTDLPGKKEPDLLEEGDLVFAARGVHNHAFAIGIKGDSSPYVASPHFFHLRIKPNEQIYDEFLAFLLNYGPSQNYFQKEAAGSLTKSIKRSTLENTPICIPSVERQIAMNDLVYAIRQERITAERLIQVGEFNLHALANNEMLRSTRD